MSADSDFEGIVEICEFYGLPDYPVHVDWENFHVTVGDYGIDPVRRDGYLTGYLVEDPNGVTQVVDDLDEFFQIVFEWGYLI